MRNYLILFTLLLLSLASTAQKRIKYTAKGKQEVVRKEGQSIRYLIDSVVFVQKETTVFCDSAIYIKAENQMRAYDHVKIINDSTVVTSDRLLYQGENRIAQLREDVVYKRGFQELYTDHLDYSLDTEVAYYFNGGKLIDTTNILSSTLGYFYAKENIARFYQSVVLESPEFILKTDTLRYNTLTKVAYSFGPTEVINKEGTIIYADGGEFRTEISQTKISSGNIETSEYILDGDELFFDDFNQYYLGEGNVKLTSKENNLILLGDEGYHDKINGFSKIYGNAIMKKIMKLDTFYIAADTMMAIESEYDSVRRILAYPDIRIFKMNVQGIADSSAYFLADSIIMLYQNPVLWTGENQVLSDTIAIHLNDSSIEKMDLKRNAFLITQDSALNFNQIKGRLMNIYFLNKSLNYIDINGNCESLFHSMDETDTVLLGINKMLTSNMTIRFLNNQILNFTLYKSPEGRFLPPHEITEADKTLDGFNWMIDRRPSLEDIFIKPIFEDALIPRNQLNEKIKPDEQELEENRKKLQETKKNKTRQGPRN
ncbi:Organic solvent tolerance protein OstA [Cyclobacteriaceae bacterium]|jgi:lipopolysaccharide export system protein LptA|nr:Organic solvent tolerance protein OstA [Cyclobacteriaceae bacterium]|tara:strand:- start:850 stop:2475 length:1626 start_codon:yes stop_codon:yes gene_type:complete